PGRRLHHRNGWIAFNEVAGLVNLAELLNQGHCRPPRRKCDAVSRKRIQIERAQDACGRKLTGHFFPLRPRETLQPFRGTRRDSRTGLHGFVPIPPECALQSQLPKRLRRPSSTHFSSQKKFAILPKFAEAAEPV